MQSTNLVRRVAQNTVGRDFIVGDVHGHFTKLKAHLDAIGFDPARGDRLFSVGDLVDRGPESEKALEWLDEPWFFAIAGNHERMAIDFADGIQEASSYLANGGHWNVFATKFEQVKHADAFRALPIAIELETAAGLIGIVHANVAGNDWGEFVKSLHGENGETIANVAQWDRSRIQRDSFYPPKDVTGVRAVVVGHTPLEAPQIIGNVHHIDTAGWHPKGWGFTVLDAETLQVVSPSAAEVA